MVENLTERFSATDVDTIVGERIRRRRILTGVTQDQLGEALGISYQQIQKYETGANRVSAGRLYLVAQKLEVSPGWFFDGLAEVPDETNDLLSSSRFAIECVRNMSRLKDDKVRSALLTMLRTLADAEEDDGQSEGPDGDGFASHAARPLAD